MLIFFIGFFAWTSWIIANTQRLAEAGWWHTKKLTPDERYSDGPFIFERFAGWVRSKEWFKATRWIVVKILVPLSFVAVLLALVAGTSYRFLLHKPFVSKGICSFAGATQTDTNANKRTEKGVIIDFDTRTPCHDTAFRIELGHEYKFEVLPDWQWKDHTTLARFDGLEKFGDNFKPTYLPSIPALRAVTKPRFLLLAEIGDGSGNIIPFSREEFSFTAPARGTLYLYVNDAISTGSVVKNWYLPGWVKSYFSDNWRTYYNDNSGTAIITITTLN